MANVQGAWVGGAAQGAGASDQKVEHLTGHAVQCSEADKAQLQQAMYEFPPTPEAAQLRLDHVNPKDYAHTRNALDGAVTHLSPYLTHGFLSVPDVASAMYHHYRLGVQHKLIYELGWREYFQHMHHHLGEGIGQSLREGVLPASEYTLELPEDVRHACTRVPAIDNAIRMLYTTGYLHNHARLWLASYVVHLRKVHWRIAADWMYSHLLDGDVASNYLSWQWVAATGSGKPYLFNADTVEKFAPEIWHSRDTSVDVSYELMDILARSAATVAQVRKNELAWDEPQVYTAPPEVFGFVKPQASDVLGKHVWLVHPWALADLPPDLPAETVCVAVAFAEHAQAHPWNALRWNFVGERMAALSPHRWLGSGPEVCEALASAQSVQTVAHLCLPDLSSAQVHLRPAPRLFRFIDKPMDSFSKWWVQVNKNVRHLQQLVYPLPARKS
jgi:deoxyribodipyrimidine photo-lyase